MRVKTAYGIITVKYEAIPIHLGPLNISAKAKIHAKSKAEANIKKLKFPLLETIFNITIGYFF